MADIDFMQETVQTMLRKNIHSYPNTGAFLRAHGLKKAASQRDFEQALVESGELMLLHSTNLWDCSEFVTSVALTHHPGSGLPLYHLVATELTEHPLYQIGNHFYYQATTGDILTRTIEKMDQSRLTV